MSAAGESQCRIPPDPVVNSSETFLARRLESFYGSASLKIRYNIRHYIRLYIPHVYPTCRGSPEIHQ